MPELAVPLDLMPRLITHRVGSVLRPSPRVSLRTAKTAFKSGPISDPPKSEWRYTVPKSEYALYEFVTWDGDDRLKMTVTTNIGGAVEVLAC